MAKNTTIKTVFDQVLAADPNLPAKQKQVLAASLALFAAQGFANTSTKQIAAKAGVAEGTVYRRYKTKDDLLAALIKPLVSEVMPRLMREFASQVVRMPTLTRHQFLTTLVANRVDFLQDNWREAKILINEMLMREDLRQQVLVQAAPVIEKNLFPVLDRLKDAGQLRDLGNDVIAQLLIGTILTNLVRANLQGDLHQFIVRTPVLIDFLDRGLAPD
ncbi:TetR/AcrR family transcriptional regulator [Levilactobacillus suantsaii]|uniref:TetR/AcrR family transcriptional regulator n=1 Tax=Levilactobacillus suantsaii TaxID=2292255 RepID=A0A4Q0VHW1_9LACO|nr:TetR/AcrR family transcriptional regulator [Levilactobacillus suantsaii]QMU08677.1 TetR/AcrR family transcriptional regulator [Levilactobacillus suantsaii]RXI78599.1 TetR/AcrR family transcriptional regulator [Levilactobacillus suantsaii]